MDVTLPALLLLSELCLHIQKKQASAKHSSDFLWLVIHDIVRTHKTASRCSIKRTKVTSKKYLFVVLLYAVLSQATGNKQHDRKSKIGRNDGRVAVKWRH